MNSVEEFELFDLESGGLNRCNVPESNGTRNLKSSSKVRDCLETFLLVVVLLAVIVGFPVLVLPFVESNANKIAGNIPTNYTASSNGSLSKVGTTEMPFFKPFTTTVISNLNISKPKSSKKQLQELPKSADCANKNASKRYEICFNCETLDHMFGSRISRTYHVTDIVETCVTDCTESGLFHHCDEITQGGTLNKHH